jgi:hypothetical protein
MGERRPIFSTKHTGQKIGYIEGHQAFDLLARPCANYDHATGLLRNLKTQMIVGYVSLKGSFVGSSSVAEEMFPASSQNGGEPLDDTFSSSEHEPFDNGSSQGERELQVQSEPVNLTRPSLQDERASSDPPGLRDVPEQHQHSLRGGWGALSEPDVADERPLDGSSLQGEREQTSGSSLQGEPEPRAEGSSQGESESLATPLEGAALAALSGSREDDRERSSRAVDPKDSSALRGVDTFMVHLAEYLRSPGAAETASELSNHDESKPGDTQNASAQNESSSVAIPEPRSINGQESLQTEPASDDDVAAAPANLRGATPIVPSPARCTQDAGRPVSFLETDAKTDQDNSQNDRCEHGPPFAANEDRSDRDVEREQIASDLNPLDVELDSALDAVKNELKDKQRLIARQVPDLAKDSLVSTDIDILVEVVTDEFGKGEHPGALEAGAEPDPRKQMENALGTVLLELEKRSR